MCFIHIKFFGVHASLPPHLTVATTIDGTTTELCPAEEDTDWKIQWPEAAPESTQSVRCPGEGDTTGLGLAHRSCLAGGVWGPVDASGCGSVAIREVKRRVREFTILVFNTGVSSCRIHLLIDFLLD